MSILKKTHIGWQKSPPRLWPFDRLSPEPFSWLSFNNDDMLPFLLACSNVDDVNEHNQYNA